MEIKIKINNSFSLKDKRKVTKSIIDYARNNLKISAAELSNNEIRNIAHMGFVTISNDNDTAKSVLEDLERRIENNYPVETIDYYIERI
ncbi:MULTISPECIES: DUF503 domain-containing protein [Anaerococcus]|uniref:Protein of uncharacterized function (DUF503) n=1 Tax=Anaerococcus octavius TaxID=54007 RepID=A0A380WT10_9FIRM|nr:MULTISPECIES: DUF503 domain-containing protein [Anaerococcus]MBS6105886.1 DUF503 domain-containing protein [Anaerococcus sp.]MDU0894192.1 DUF503 domain-containing protein [Anaerococcus sp.]MDU3177072.1 DUF503 domain-containing protein [Anaerococcus sp.]MDU4025557.1 DUF503 domain-containing protein [Anaerococcus sp.]MDU7412238.1 DUF503 domain-containing protein [Anaerococcus sp.]